MYCDDEVIERALNSAINSNNIVEEYQPDAESDSDLATPPEKLPAHPSTAGDDQIVRMTPVNYLVSLPVKVSPQQAVVTCHVPLVAPKKAIHHLKLTPMTATVVNMTPRQKETQLKLAPVQIVPYESGKSLKFPYDPIEWPKTPKQYILEWFQRQSSLRVNKQLAAIDPQRAAAMAQVPKWEKLPAPALRQGLHLVTLHVTDPRTLQSLTFTPARYWRYVLECFPQMQLLTNHIAAPLKRPSTWRVCYFCSICCHKRIQQKKFTKQWRTCNDIRSG